jgi:hypothetical protein
MKQFYAPSLHDFEDVSCGAVNLVRLDVISSLFLILDGCFRWKCLLSWPGVLRNGYACLLVNFSCLDRENNYWSLLLVD